MIFLSGQPNVKEEDLIIVQELFAATVGEKINLESEELLTREIEQFIQLLYQHFSLDFAKYNVDIRQFHILYLIGYLFLDYNKTKINMDNVQFQDKIYFPNILNIIIIHLGQCKKLLYKIVRDTYKDIEIESKQIIEFYFVIYNVESSIIQNDILSIFLKGIFLNIDPFDIQDLKDYYSAMFRYLFYSYLKNRTAGMTSFEIDPAILQDERIVMISSRYKIFEEGVRVSQIQELCNHSDTLVQISKNYDKLKDKLITNELQQLYSCIIQKESTCDQKLIILKLNSNCDLNHVKRNAPIVYKLLRSVHVVSETDYFTEDSRILIYNSIFSVLHTSFRKRLDDKDAVFLAKSVSTNLTVSLTKGKYLDPYTMQSVNIKSHTFAKQLKIFLTTLLKDVLNDGDSRRYT